jgi:hypothetical protein
MLSLEIGDTISIAENTEFKAGYGDSGSKNTKIGQLQMVYLFLSLEDKISNEGLEKLHNLVSKMKLSKEDEDSIIETSEKILSKSFDKDDRFDVIYEGIIGIVESYFRWADKKAEQKQALWLLINSAYCDGNYTFDKKRLLRTIMRKFNIDNSVLAEMEDTAETLLDLENHRTWIKKASAEYGYDYIDSVIKELDKNKVELANNISLVMSIG